MRRPQLFQQGHAPVEAHPFPQPIAVLGAVVVDAGHGERVAHEEHPQRAGLGQQPPVVQRLAGKMVRRHAELVPRPRLPIGQNPVHPDGMRRDARQAPRQGVGDDLGHVLFGQHRARKGLLERGHPIDVVVVVMSDPQALDAADFALVHQGPQPLDDLRAAAIHDQRGFVLRDEHPGGAEMPQALGRWPARADGHVVRPARVLRKHLGKIMPQGRDGHVLVVARFQPAHEALDSPGRGRDQFAVRRDQPVRPGRS